ncbi:hypothetical protein SAMN02745673_00658 [Marinactinospora thermotolerans DSM 45154]|uniref:Uncharacterized protein n=2 Tax=Marinactinospora thermotolerans TaxID=531310 RepID=A0A1T4LFL8_9ACTN|nr:hypothetical protein SAMN02745673_00658 [Marinactinospora thermotolerans DSM 45154]
MSFDMPTSAPGLLDEHEQLRSRVEEVRDRAVKAAPWTPRSPLHGRFGPRTDIPLSDADNAFYAGAQAQVTAFADLCLSLLSLHQPRDGGGLSSGPTPAVQRCTCCMLLWPCPTIREMTRLLT